MAEIGCTETTPRRANSAFITSSGVLSGDGITVNSVQPGVHATDRMTQLYGDDLGSMARGIPAGFVGDAGDFGQVVAFLCSEHARFVTGVHLPVDGGAIAGLL